jgi:hypothetical protein
MFEKGRGEREGSKGGKDWEEKIRREKDRERER